MPQLRKDPITGRWVIISTERAKRPHDYSLIEHQNDENGFCPFCPGNEKETPGEVLAYREGNSPPNTPGWYLRVVPNKFPALMIEGDLGREGEGVYDLMNGVGAHEVIIESPQHDKKFSELEGIEMERVMYAFRDRILDLRRDSRLRYILIFKNRGAAAGASLYHTHSQLIALPIVPKTVKEELVGCRNYYDMKERCIFCDIVRQELRDGSRIVLENDQMVALCPYAPRFPFEVWILPKNHNAFFEDSKDYEFRGLAQAMTLVFKKLDKALNNPPYNFILHTSPISDKTTTYYHWHFEIMPTLTKVAGFEWGSGFYINHTPPENSAEFLRELDV